LLYPVLINIISNAFFIFTFENKSNIPMQIKPWYIARLTSTVECIRCESYFNNWVG